MEILGFPPSSLNYILSMAVFNTAKVLNRIQESSNLKAIHFSALFPFGGGRRVLFASLAN